VLFTFSASIKVYVDIHMVSTWTGDMGWLKMAIF